MRLKLLTVMRVSHVCIRRILASIDHLIARTREGCPPDTAREIARAREDPSAARAARARGRAGGNPRAEPARAGRAGARERDEARARARETTRARERAPNEPDTRATRERENARETSARERTQARPRRLASILELHVEAQDEAVAVAVIATAEGTSSCGEPSCGADVAGTRHGGRRCHWPSSLTPMTSSAAGIDTVDAVVGDCRR